MTAGHRRRAVAPRVLLPGQLMNRNSDWAQASCVARHRPDAPEAGPCSPRHFVLLANLGLLAPAIARRALTADDLRRAQTGRGLVLLVIDGSISASSIRLDGPGIFGDGLARGTWAGHQHPPHARRGSTSGRAQRANAFWGGYSFYALSHSACFRVEAGVISYRRLPHAFAGGNYSLFRRVNRATIP